MKASHVGKNNIRILRGWAKSKGREKVPNPSGKPEIWGKQINKEFKWHLHLKPEASNRVGLHSSSNLPRFDTRINLHGNSYINPFTNRIGSADIGTHIPLNFKY